MTKTTDNYSAFEGINLSNARSEGESYEDYRKRLKQNKDILKLYNTVGRDNFKEMFPNGVQEALKNSAEEAYNENAKELGEVKQISYISYMNKANIQSIVDKVYSKIKSDYGLSKWNDFPNVEIHNNIYEMSSGIKGMMGEEKAQANFCNKSNTIQLFYSEIKDTKHVIQCLLHEYRHYLQSASWHTRYYAMGYDYTNHPYELAAKEEEKNYKKYMKEFGESK